MTLATRTAGLLLAVTTLAVGCSDNYETRSPARGAAPLAGDATGLELYSLGSTGDSSADAFHGHAVLGRASVDDAADRATLLTAFGKASWEWIGTPRNALACAGSPDRGLRLTRGDATVDYVICFDCGDVEAFGLVDAKAARFHVDRTARPAFDEAFRRAGLPLAGAAPAATLP